MKTNTAFAIFRNQDEVDAAQAILLEAGFAPSQLSVVFPQTRGTQEFSYKYKTHIATGAQIGAATGLFVGAILGLLAGIEAIALPLVQNGASLWLYCAIGGLLGLLFGTGAGALVGIGTPVQVSARFAEYLDEGGMMLSVHEDDMERLSEAMAILDECGGNDVSTSNEKRLYAETMTHGLPTNPLWRVLRS